MVDQRGRQIGRGAVFVDTSGLYALLNPRDERHDLARDLYEQVVSSRRDFVTTNFVLLELHALITNRRQARRATETLFDIEGGDKLVVRVEPEDELLARQILRQYTDKGFSLLDATSSAVMERLELDTALTFDKHFRQYGLTVLEA